jgi:hypothetical protein
MDETEGFFPERKLLAYRRSLLVQPDPFRLPAPPDTKSEADFPEREFLRARRLRAMADQPVHLSEARTRSTGMWVVWVAAFLPMFVNGTTLGWNGHISPRSMAVTGFSLWVLLAACVLLVAVGTWKSLNRSQD